MPTFNHGWVQDAKNGGGGGSKGRLEAMHYCTVMVGVADAGGRLSGMFNDGNQREGCETPRVWLTARLLSYQRPASSNLP